MSRLTGNDAYGLMEAYNNVYAPQELTEEQVWEEVENWVNALLEEGYDLSDYTWEEMYEEYLSEAPLPTGNFKQTQSAGRASTVTRNLYRSSSDNKVYKNYNDALAAKNSRQLGAKMVASSTANVTSPTQKPAATGTQKPAATGTQKPAATGTQKPVPGGAPKPAAPAAAKPAPTKSSTGMLGKTSFERRTPTSAELKSAQAARAGGAKPEQALQAAKSSETTQKIQSAGNAAGAAAFKPVSTSAATAAAPSNNANTSGNVAPVTNKIAAAKPPSRMPLNQSYEYDAYDLVLEYLFSQGHAETLDEAHYVMMEMDAEMIGSIVEGSYEDKIAANNKKYDANRKRAAQRAAARNDARAQGKTGAVPGVGYVTKRKENETYTDSSGKTRHGKGL